MNLPYWLQKIENSYENSKRILQSKKDIRKYRNTLIYLKYKGVIDEDDLETVQKEIDKFRTVDEELKIAEQWVQKFEKSYKVGLVKYKKWKMERDFDKCSDQNENIKNESDINT